MTILSGDASLFDSRIASDHDLVRSNCDRLGIPVPVVAWRPYTNNNIGATEVGIPHAGSRRDTTLARNSSSHAIFAQPTGRALPVLHTDGSTFSNCTIIPGPDVSSNQTIFVVMTPSAHNTLENNIILAQASSFSATANVGWRLAGHTPGTGTDFKPSYQFNVGSTAYICTDTNTWAQDERLVLCGVRQDANIYLYRAGFQVATTSCSSSASNQPTSNIFVGCAPDTVSNQNTNGDYECILIWDSALSASQVAMISDNPYVLWESIDDDDPAVRVPSNILTGAANFTVYATIVGAGSLSSTDVLWCGRVSLKLFRQSGDFTSTIRASLSVSPNRPDDISYDGTDTYWCGQNNAITDSKLFKQSGSFSSTIKSSLSVYSKDYQATGIDWDRHDIRWTGFQTNKLYASSGVFSSTLKTSIGITPFYSDPESISSNRTYDSLWLAGSATKVLYWSGRFSSTVRSSFDWSSQGYDQLRGIGNDGTDTFIAGIDSVATPYLLKFQGQVTTTLLAFLDVTSHENNSLTGIESTRINARLELIKQATSSMSAVVTMTATGIAGQAASFGASAAVVITASGVLQGACQMMVAASMAVDALSVIQAAFDAQSATANLACAGVVNAKSGAAAMTAKATMVCTGARLIPANIHMFATATVDMDVVAIEEVTIPSDPGSLVDPLDQTKFQLIINGTIIDLSDRVQMGDLHNSYNNGKELTFNEIPNTVYGQPSYTAMSSVLLKMNLNNTGLKCYFRGAIRQVNYRGQRGGEEIGYTAFGMGQLANEVQLVTENYGIQRVGIELYVPTTVSTLFGNLPYTYKPPLTVPDAITQLFSIMQSRLGSFGIPIAYAPTDAGSVYLPEPMNLSGGFFSALQQICNYMPGLKPYFDDENQIWRFHSVFDAKTTRIRIQSLQIDDHALQISLENRYTAIQLFENFKARGNTSLPMKLSRIDTVMPDWDPSLEDEWSAGEAGTELNSDGTRNPLWSVYRCFLVPTQVFCVPPGWPAQLWHTQYDAEMNPISPLADRSCVSVEAKLMAWPGAIDPASAALSNKNPSYLPTFLSTIPFNVGYGRIIANAPVMYDGNPDDPGDAVGVMSQDAIAAVGTDPVYVTLMTPTNSVGYQRIYRYPAGDDTWQGTAYTIYGIKRVRYEEVSQGDATLETAKAMLRLYKDVIVSGEIGVFGDPIPELINLNRRIQFVHNINPTPVASYEMTMLGFRYTFGKPGINGLTISTDMQQIARVGG